MFHIFHNYKLIASGKNTSNWTYKIYQCKKCNKLKGYITDSCNAMKTKLDAVEIDIYLNGFE